MARELTRLLDIDQYVPMLVERFGYRWGGDWPIEIDGRQAMAFGVVSLSQADLDWIGEQTPARARPFIHPRPVRRSLDGLHQIDEAVFTRLVDLENDGTVAAGWNVAVDVTENRIVVVLAREAPTDISSRLLDVAPPHAAVVMTAVDAPSRIRALVAPARPERSVGAKALGAAMTVVGEIVHGRNDDTETEIVVSDDGGDPPLDLDYGGLDPL